MKIFGVSLSLLLIMIYFFYFANANMRWTYNRQPYQHQPVIYNPYQSTYYPYQQMNPNPPQQTFLPVTQSQNSTAESYILHELDIFHNNVKDVIAKTKSKLMQMIL